MRTGTCFFTCDTTTAKYNSWDDLEKLEKKEQDWLPSFLFNEKVFANNIFEIIENHNLDTNEVWGKLYYEFDISLIFTFWKEEILTEIKVLKKNINRLKRLGFNQKKELTVYSFTDKNISWIIFIDSQSNRLFFIGTYNK